MFVNQIFLSVFHIAVILFLFCILALDQSNASASKKASYHAEMMIEMPFVMFCTSAALPYLCVVIRLTLYLPG